ncbi:CD63 antigen-like [Bacillus rossius redtenbacheri]|uniref:CD63 antigen-like n=1 Tax=Bacillus rossius redtenbacheri TaxID=93214 RepID=UPI002FDCE4D3
MVSGGMSCVKYLLFAFNLLFAISGLAILVVGAVIQDAFSDYTNFVQGQLFVAPVILIVVGIIVFVVAFFGCCGALKENHCMIVTFAVLLLAIFVLELAGGITGYLLKDDVKDLLGKSLNETALHYETNKDYKNSWDIMQTDLKCCGIVEPSDWNNILKNATEFPRSCCQNMPTSEHCSVELASPTGCLSALQKFFVHYAYVLGGMGIGIGLVQLIGVVFACCLAKSIRKEYETV